MVEILLRAIGAIASVCVAILVARAYGDGEIAQLLTVSITATAVALFEVAMRWLPKRFRWFRDLLDPRSVFAGAWVQEMAFVHGGPEAAAMRPNRFALFLVRYDAANDGYSLAGTSFQPNGDEFARWESRDVVHFAKDGRSLTYLWGGAITAKPGGGDVAERQAAARTGFARITLDGDDSGRGRVEHVARNVQLEFDVVRVTPEWLRRLGLPGISPERLRDPEARRKVAVAWAQRKAAHA